MDVVIGRLGRAHGVRGEVSVDVRTDEPDLRFATGSVLWARDPAGDGRADRLTVQQTRLHGKRLLVTFAELSSRTEAESLRGAELVGEVRTDTSPESADEFYDRQLVGLEVLTTDGRSIGVVSQVQHLPAQDLLVVQGADRTHLVPFVAALVPEVDLAAGTVCVEPVPGLLDDSDLRA